MQGHERSVAARRTVLQREPSVSVVIPTYNRAASLQRLLDALERSIVPPGGLEIVVVDDGSTDSTPEVAARAGIRYLRQPNAGPAAARERGWRYATGEAVVFLDDDVVPEPEAIQRMVEGLDSADGVGATIRPLDTTSVIAQYMHVDGIVNHRVAHEEVLWLTTPAVAFRRAALEHVGGFDTRFYPAGEDVDLASRLLEAGCVLRVAAGAVVRHDHRSRFGQLLLTLYRYGGGFRMLASRHTGFRKERVRTGLRRLNPMEWLRLYRSYRREASVRRSLAFVLLHAFVVLPYLLGVIAGQRALAIRRPSSSIFLAPDGGALELIGVPQLAQLREEQHEKALAG